MVEANEANSLSETMIFAALMALEEEQNLWQLRSIETIDLTEGLDTYLDHFTIDIDVQVLNHWFSQEFRYIPLGWRARTTFLELDCKANSGESLQLMPLSFRHRYAEWKFWNLVEQSDIMFTGSNVPGCIRARVVKTIAKSDTGNELLSGDCKNHACGHEQTWQAILSHESVGRAYRDLQNREPLILKAQPHYDLSIVKLQERRQLELPRRNLREWLSSEGAGVISARRAATTKVIAPDDLRIHKLERIDLEYSTSDEAEVYGDGSWAHYSRESPGRQQTIAQSQRSGEFLKWIAVFHPRRSHLLVPGVLILVPSIFLWTYWLTAGSWKSLSYAADSIPFGDVAKKPSFAFLAAYFTANIPPLFYRSHERSHLYNSVTRWPYWGLATRMFLTLVFPFLPNIARIVNNVSSALLGTEQHRHGILLSCRIFCFSWLLLHLFMFCWALIRSTKQCKCVS